MAKPFYVKKPKTNDYVKVLGVHHLVNRFITDGKTYRFNDGNRTMTIK